MSDVRSRDESFQFFQLSTTRSLLFRTQGSCSGSTEIRTFGLLNGILLARRRSSSLTTHDLTTARAALLLNAATRRCFWNPNQCLHSCSTRLPILVTALAEREAVSQLTQDLNHSFHARDKCNRDEFDAPLEIDRTFGSSGGAPFGSRSTRAIPSRKNSGRTKSYARSNWIDQLC